jgi:hypothetical protein
VGQQYGQLALAAIAQGHLDEGRHRLATAFEAIGVDENLIDVAFLLAHSAVLAAVEERVVDAARARAASDGVMARLGLVHWHMFERARIAALGTAPVPDPTIVQAEAEGADPWDVLRATLDPPT